MNLTNSPFVSATAGDVIVYKLVDLSKSSVFHVLVNRLLPVRLGGQLLLRLLLSVYISQP